MSIAIVFVSSLVGFFVSAMYFLSGGTALGAFVALVLLGLATSLGCIVVGNFRSTKSGVEIGVGSEDDQCGNTLPDFPRSGRAPVALGEARFVRTGSDGSERIFALVQPRS